MSKTHDVPDAPDAAEDAVIPHVVPPVDAVEDDESGDRTTAIEREPDGEAPDMERIEPDDDAEPDFSTVDA